MTPEEDPPIPGEQMLAEEGIEPKPTVGICTQSARRPPMPESKHRGDYLRQLVSSRLVSPGELENEKAVGVTFDEAQPFRPGKILKPGDKPPPSWPQPEDEPRLGSGPVITQIDENMKTVREQRKTGG